MTQRKYFLIAVDITDDHVQPMTVAAAVSAGLATITRRGYKIGQPRMLQTAEVIAAMRKVVQNR